VVQVQGIGHGFGPGGSGSDEDLVANFTKRYMKMDNMQVENAMSHRDMIRVVYVVAMIMKMM